MHLILNYSMKAGSRDHLNGSSEAINEEDTSAPSDVSIYEIRISYKLLIGSTIDDDSQ